MLETCLTFKRHFHGLYLDLWGYNWIQHLLIIVSQSRLNLGESKMDEDDLALSPLTPARVCMIYSPIQNENIDSQFKRQEKCKTLFSISLYYLFDFYLLFTLYSMKQI
jgi:hypothetical protein